MDDILMLLQQAAKMSVSDIFISAGAAVTFKVDGALTPVGEKLMPSDTQELVNSIYRLSGRPSAHFEETGDDDFSFSISSVARFRANIFRQRGSCAAVIRVVAFGIPDYRTLHIPEEVMELASIKSGMIIFCGTAGSGKSTTQACIIDRINQTRSCHVITLEDPIEYLHRNNKAIVNQREIAVDTADYPSALRSCIRQSPDVIQMGEIRDLDSIRTAMTAAETGHLIITTLHTGSTVNALDRIIDVFPPEQQAQIRIQLSTTLRCVVCQQLLPGLNGRRVPAYELMRINDAVRSMIRDGRNYQIANAIASGSADGMISMDLSLFTLVRRGLISEEAALSASVNCEQLRRRLSEK